MVQQLSESFLGTIQPINELSEANRHLLLEHARVAELPAGTRLTYPKEEGWLIYVLDGEACLASNAGVMDTVVAGSERAKSPLFTDASLAKVAVTARPTVLVRFDRALFDDLQLQDRNAGIEVREANPTQTETSVFQAIYSAYENDELQLPTFPEVAMKVRKLLADPDVGISDLIAVVNADPTIAGKLIQASNSPMYRGRHSFQTVRDAVVRLGLGIASQVVTGIALQQTFSVESPLLEKRVRELWQHCVRVAGFSYLIAKEYGGFDPERALLAGLLHDIGAIPILQYADKSGIDLNDVGLDQAVDNLRDLVGVLVINTWELGPEMATVVAECTHWERDPYEERDLCDVVVLALYLAKSEEGTAEALPDLSDMPAARKFGVLNPEDTRELVEKGRDALASLQQFLGF